MDPENLVPGDLWNFTAPNILKNGIDPDTAASIRKLVEQYALEHGFIDAETGELTVGDYGDYKYGNKTVKNNTRYEKPKFPREGSYVFEETECKFDFEITPMDPEYEPMNVLGIDPIIEVPEDMLPYDDEDIIDPR